MATLFSVFALFSLCSLFALFPLFAPFSLFPLFSLFYLFSFFLLPHSCFPSVFPLPALPGFSVSHLSECST